MFAFLKFVIIISGLMCLMAVRSQAQVDCYVKSSTACEESAAETEQLILSCYGQIIHSTSTGEFLCKAPSFQRFDSLLEQAHCLVIRSSSNNSQNVGGADITPLFSVFKLLTADSDESAKFIPEQPDSVICGQRTILAENSALAPPVSPWITQSDMNTAMYLVGSVALCVMTVDGPGSADSWTNAELDSAEMRTILACDRLSLTAKSRNVRLSWKYEFHRNVAVTENPITVERPNFQTFPPNWIFGWIDDALATLGVGSEWTGSYANANRMRRQYRTDWGASLFIVKNDTKPSFGNGYAGYMVSFKETLSGAKNRGPFAVAVYHGSNRTIAHELSHVFGAADEYDGAAGCNESADCDDIYGYLAHPNENCVRCGPDREFCLMGKSSESGLGYYICSHTNKHLGWSDFDYDGHCDAIEPHSTHWATLWYAQPGDLVRIFTLSGQFVTGISVSPERVDVRGDPNIFWDGLNYQSQPVAPGVYYYTINNGQPRTFGLNSESGHQPRFSGFSYAHDTLIWELDTSMAYISTEIYAHDRRYNDTFLVAKLQWDQFHLSSYNAPHKKLSTVGFECSPCIAKFTGWRPDGQLAAPSTYTFSTYKCGDSNDDGSVDLTDLQAYIDYMFAPFIHPAAPEHALDFNCDQATDITDLQVLIDYFFFGGTAPLCCW